MRRGRRQTQVPGYQIPEDGAEEGAQHDTGIHDTGIDEPLANRLGYCRADHEGGRKVEEGGPNHRDARSQDPGGDHCGNGVGAVVEPVDEIEREGDRDDDQNVDDVVAHAQACLMEMDSSTLPTSSMWSSVFSIVS